MSDTAEQVAVAPGEGSRPMRKDAKRNRELLLAAARAAFTERGAEASLEDIARRAGVGVGTLYRHFPTRPELLEAVYVKEVEALCRSAVAGAGTSSWDALVNWLDGFVAYVATKKALMDELMATLGTQAVVFRTCHDAIFDAGKPLLAAAQTDGAVRADVEFIDVIRMVGGLTMMRHASQDEVRRVLRMALDGLRYGAPSASG